MKINVDDYIPARVETAEELLLTELEQYLIVSLLSDIYSAITEILDRDDEGADKLIKIALNSMDGLITYLKSGKAHPMWLKAGTDQRYAANMRGANLSYSFKTMRTYEKILREGPVGKKLADIIEDDDYRKGSSKFFLRFRKVAKDMGVRPAVIKAYEVVNKRFLVALQDG